MKGTPDHERPPPPPPLPDTISIRPLARLDLDAVVAIDAAIEGRPRRVYFERRLRAALERAGAARAVRRLRCSTGSPATSSRASSKANSARRENALRLEVVGARADLVGPRRRFAACRRARRMGAPPRHDARSGRVAAVERSPDGRVAGPAGIRTRAEPRRRLRGARRRVHACSATMSSRCRWVRARRRKSPTAAASRTISSDSLATTPTFARCGRRTSRDIVRIDRDITGPQSARTMCGTSSTRRWSTRRSAFR